ncbi:MAG: C39 family peptidase [Coriobacteriia bacterium]|nr:C39 family peptidase [Coriobacteriia bacterium]
MIDEMGDLLSVLSDVVLSFEPAAAGETGAAGADTYYSGFWSDCTNEPPDPQAFGASRTPWDSSSTVSYREDWDRDGVPNYADHWFGPGARSPFGAAGESPSTVGMEAADLVEVETALRQPNGYGDWPGHEHGGRVTEGEALSDLDAHTTPPDVLPWADSDSDGSPGAPPYEESPAIEREAFPPDGTTVTSFTQAAPVTVIVGDPIGSTEYWCQQEEMNSCGVATQRGVIEAVTGQRVPEAELADLAESRGWYDPTCGTAPDAVGNLLEEYNVPVIRSYDTSFEALLDALAKGEKVIVGVDANEIWSQLVDASGSPIEQPDAGHAVWVTGIEFSADGSVQVVVNDPGHSAGAGVRVPVDHFENAWKDFGHYAVITEIQEASIV